MHSGKHSGTVAVVLNYRTPHETIAAVRSIQASHTAATILVVDNASGDRSLDLLRGHLSGVHLIAAANNEGFSVGCNLGIAEALERGAARLLLLNSDATIDSGALDLLEQALDSDARLGIVAPVIVSRGKPDEIQSLGISYSTKTGRMWHRGFGRSRATLPPFDRQAVDAVSGCAMLIRREVFDTVGLLPQEYFFGFEDLDYCLRARAAGFAIACIGGATVRHEGSLSMGRRSGLRSYYATRNHLRVASRFGASRPPLRALRVVSVLALNFAHALTMSEVPIPEALAGFLRGARDHFKGRYGAAPVAGTTRAQPPNG